MLFGNEIFYIYASILRKNSNLRKLYLIITLIFLITSCSESEIVKGTNKYIEFAKSNRMGNGQDFWLEKRSDFYPDEWDKVSLILGYGDDYEGCMDIIDALNKKYPTNQYRCLAAN